MSAWDTLPSSRRDRREPTRREDALKRLEGALQRLRDLTWRLKGTQLAKADERRSSVFDDVLEISDVVRVLDPQHRRREARRRIPWRAYEAVNRKWPHLHLTARIEAFVAEGCKELASQLRLGRVAWADPDHLRRLGAFVRAAKSGKLLGTIKPADLDWLTCYCNQALVKLCEWEKTRLSDDARKVFAVALFHDVWFIHRTKGIESWNLLDALKFLASDTEHPEFIQQLHSAAGRLFPFTNVMDLRADRRLRNDKRRKQIARKAARAQGTGG